MVGMTKAEAISWLRRYKRDTIVYGVKPWSPRWKEKNYPFNRYIYEQVLIRELIRKIRESNSSPESVVRDFYHFMDDILSESEDDQFITHYFAAIMENSAGDILRYLRERDAESKGETK